MKNEIRLSEKGWWEEIGEKNLPQELVMVLRDLITAALKGFTPPLAVPQLVVLVNEHLGEGVWVGKNYYQVVVSTLNEQKGAFERFKLIKTYPDSKSARHEELVK